MKKSLFKNSIYKSLLNLANIIIPLVIGPYITHLMNIDLYGAYNKVYAEFQVVLIFASFGVYTFGMREISKVRDDPKKVSQLFSNLFFISLISNIIISVFYLLYAWNTSSSDVELMIYFIMMIQIVGNIFYIEFVNEALENYKFITIKTLIIKIFYLVALLVFVREATDIYIYAIIICLTVFFNNFVSFMYAKRYIKFDFSNLSFKRYIKPLLFVLIFTNVDMLYSQLDRIMLGNLVDPVSVTLYYIPYYIVSTLVSFPYAIIVVSIPRLSYVVEVEGKKQYEEILRNSISSLLFMIVPMCFGLFVLSDEIITLYSGSQYIGSGMGTILALAALSRIIISIESVHTNLVMYPNNQEQRLILFAGCFGACNLLMNFILVWCGIFTPLTALATTTVAELLYAITEHIYIRKKLGIIVPIFEKRNLNYFFLSILFIPIAFLVKLFNFSMIVNIVLIILICGIIYVGVLYLKKDHILLYLYDKFFKRNRLGKQRG